MTYKRTSIVILTATLAALVWFAGHARAQTHLQCDVDYVWQDGDGCVLAGKALTHPSPLTSSPTSSTMLNSPIIATPKSGVVKPTIVTDDYRRAVCDMARIIFPREAKAITLMYDDGSIEFDCAHYLK